MTDEEYLNCPECDWQAIPASEYVWRDMRRGKPYGTWCEDDEATCPGCGIRLRANITNDGDGLEYVEAIKVTP